MVSDGFRRTVVVALVLSLLVAPWTAAAAPLGDTAQVDPDNVLLRVSLQPDGSAVWQVEYRVLLDDDNATAAFESLADDIRTNETAYVDRFGDRMRNTVASAENATGREMAVRNVSVHTERTTLFGPDREYGVVVYSFHWVGFGVADGDRIEAGDAVTGLFLDEQTRMIVSWPEEYSLERAEPDPDETRDNAVVWDGRLDFATDEPRVVVRSSAAPGDSDPGDGAGGGFPADLFVVASLLAVVTIGAAGWLYVKRSGSDGTAVEQGDDDDTGGETEPPEELLSNEERVLRLLEEHDGRVKQQQVAQELDWTDAKTSQVVGDLREDGAIEVFRLGRENVLTLPGEDEL